MRLPTQNGLSGGSKRGCKNGLTVAIFHAGCSSSSIWPVKIRGQEIGPCPGVRIFSESLYPIQCPISRGTLSALRIRSVY
jgi:hypothetical protein